MTAEEFIRLGKIDEALAAVKDEVRKHPSDANQRVLLFQLLLITGQWDKALTQLNVASDLDARNLLMAQVCRLALMCESLREEVFSGRTTPMVLGQPPEWLGQLIQALQLDSQGKADEAQRLRDSAFESAPATSGSINGEKFAWLADSDPRLGPVLEAMVDGKYYWIPFNNIRKIQIEKPADLRDLVWISAEFTWSNEGKAVGLIPVRYPGSEKQSDSAIRMARKTQWSTEGPIAAGLGQREFATDQSQYALLETREIQFDQPDAPVGQAATGGASAHG
jgi:type VI secretion system protein ImpE